MEEFTGDTEMPKGSMHIKGYELEDYKTENKFKRHDMIELIQYVVANPDLNPYGSVSKDTAKYFLDDFLLRRK